MEVQNNNIIKKKYNRKNKQNKGRNLIRINLKDIFKTEFQFDDNIINYDKFFDLNRTITEYDSDIEKEDKIIIKYNKESKKKFNGRWNKKEKKIFLEGFFKFRNNWKKLNEVVRTRSIIQLRSHAQKFMMRIQKLIENIDNENIIKKKIEELFQRELKEKYNPLYLNKFTLYIIKNTKFSNNNKLIKNCLKEKLSSSITYKSYKFKSKKFIKDKKKNDNNEKKKDNSNCDLNQNNDLIDSEINKNSDNKQSLDFNSLSLNYFNSENNEKENKFGLFNYGKNEFDYFLKNESLNKDDNFFNDDDLFAFNEPNNMNFGNNIIQPTGPNDYDYFDKFDYFGDNLFKKV